MTEDLTGLEETGPIDYLVVAFPHANLTGEAFPLLVDLVDKGIIRILDLAFIQKSEDGSVTGLELAQLADGGVGRGPRLRERLGRTVRCGASPLRRPAGRQRPDPRPGRPRRARRDRGIRTHTRLTRSE